MICPECHNQIPNGSNICPLCFANLAGRDIDVSQPHSPTPQKAPRKNDNPYRRRSKSRSSGSRSVLPMVVTIGIILLLVVVIVLIIRSMFTMSPQPMPTAAPIVQSTAGTEIASGTITIFGTTPTPAAPSITPELEEIYFNTPEPVIEQPSVAEAPAVEYHTLRKGDQGIEVATLQRALTELGYLSTASDGIYGTGTMNAVKKFQSDNGLDADGIAGKQTQALLYEKTTVQLEPKATVAPGDILDLPG